MKSELDCIVQAHKAGAVNRFHTVRLIHSESVAAHSWCVVNMVLALTHGSASRGLILASHLHDVGEIATGDIPSPVKKALGKGAYDEWQGMEDAAKESMFPYLNGRDYITEEEMHILKVADNMSGLLTCLTEYRMGNRMIREIGDRYVAYLQDICNLMPKPTAELIHEWQQEMIYGGK